MHSPFPASFTKHTLAYMEFICYFCLYVSCHGYLECFQSRDTVNTSVSKSLFKHRFPSPEYMAKVEEQNGVVGGSSASSQIAKLLANEAASFKNGISPQTVCKWSSPLCRHQHVVWVQWSSFIYPGDM